MTDWFGGRGQGKWLTGLVAGGKANDWLMWWCSDTVVGGKANDWLVWWQGARQMTDWLGGRGQGKCLTNVVTRWCGDAVMQDAVVGGKANDWLMWWCSDAVVGGKANDWLVWWQGARQMTDWLGGRGQGKCLTNVVTRWCGDAVMQDAVVGGKANDWLMRWHGDVVAQWRSDAVMQWHGDTVMQWCGGRGQGKWLTGLVAGGKANDWLTQWCSDAVVQWYGDVVAWDFPVKPIINHWWS